MDAAFSKYFWGAGHKESGDGFGAKGTQASAQTTQASKGGLGACSPREFFKFRQSQMQFSAIWKFKVTKFHIWN